MATRKEPVKSAESPLVRLRGRLDRQIVRAGTASQHESWVLASPTHGVLALKNLKGGNMFSLGRPPADPGSEIEVEGYLRKGEIRYLSVKPL